MNGLQAAALAAWLVAGAAAAAPFEVLRHRESEQHPQLILAPRDGELATLVVAFPAGRFDDGDDRGVTRLAQHVMLEANKRGRYEDLVRELFGTGATLQIHTGLRQSAFVLTAHAQDFPKLAERVLTLTLSPVMDPARMEAAAQRTAQDPALTAGRGSIEGWLALAAVTDTRYHAQPLLRARDVLSYPEERVKRCLNGVLSPRNATVIAAGAIDGEALRATLKRFHGGLPARVSRPSFTLPIIEKIASPNEVHVVSYPMELTSPQQSAAVRVLGHVLRDLLEQRFRRVGVGYSFSSGPLVLPWMSGLVVTLPAEDPSKVDLGPFLLEEVARVREGKVPAEWVMRGRSRVLAELKAADSSPESVAAELATGLYTPAWYDAALVTELQALTPESFTRTIAPWLQEERRIHLVFTQPPRPPSEEQQP